VVRASHVRAETPARAGRCCASCPAPLVVVEHPTNGVEACSHPRLPREVERRRRATL
jgi:hypothetical protein